MMFEPYNPDRKKQTFPVAVREATEADVENIARISIDREPGDFDKIVSGLRSHISNSSESFILVAVVENRIAGFGKAKRFEGEGIDYPGWYLAGLIVVPEFRNGKVGSLLTVSRLEKIAQVDTEVYYFANAANRLSLELHTKLGFELVQEPFEFPNVSFTGSHGQLYRKQLR